MKQIVWISIKLCYQKTVGKAIWRRENIKYKMYWTCDLVGKLVMGEYTVSFW